MIMVLRWENYNSNGQSYISHDIIVFNDKKDLDEILKLTENRGFANHNRLEDHSSKQYNFDQAGGFNSKLLSARDIDGNDLSDLIEDWFGRPIE
jgi:hypothetical protein